MLGGGEVDGEGLQVAIVDADDAGVGGEGAFEFGEVVNFDQGIELEGVGDFEEVLEGGLVESGDDEEDGIGSGDDGFEDLGLVDDEIFAQARDVELFADEREVFETALEVLFVCEDGDGAGTGFLIAPSDGQGIKVRCDGADGG